MKLLFLLFISIFIYESIEDFYYKEINLIIHIINIVISFFIWKIFYIYILFLLLYYLFYNFFKKHIGVGDILYFIIYFYRNSFISFTTKYYLLLFSILIIFTIYNYLFLKFSKESLKSLPLIPAILISFIIINLYNFYIVINQ